MNDDDTPSPDESFLVRPVSRVTPSLPDAGNCGDGGATLLPSSSSPDWSTSATTATQVRKPKVRRLLTNKKCRSILGAALLAPMIGLSVGLATSPAASAAQPASGARPAGAPGSGVGSNARSAPAPGGSSGTVDGVSKSGFTLTTSAGQKVTVDEAPTTKFKKGTTSISASAIKKGAHVLVLGTVSSTTIKATQVIVQTSGNGKSAASTAATVIPFQKGAPTTSKQVGQIPASYSQGSGSIVSGTAANKATEAALAAYPGGIIDRVVKLSNGEYEVHTIGVNWPHHIFVNQDFKVVGAE